MSATIQKKSTSRTPKVTVAMSREMIDGLEEERKLRRLGTIPEVLRAIISDYFVKLESERRS